MNTEYIVICTTYSTPTGFRTTYGIAYLQNSDDNAVLLESITDLTCDAEEAEHFVSLCNELSLDPIHLSDVIDDYLTSV